MLDPHPDCPDEFHGADGGACSTCGWDAYSLTLAEGEEPITYRDFYPRDVLAMVNRRMEPMPHLSECYLMLYPEDPAKHCTCGDWSP